jgi:hypothetical protein
VEGAPTLRALAPEVELEEDIGEVLFVVGELPGMDDGDEARLDATADERAERRPLGTARRHSGARCSSVAPLAASARSTSVSVRPHSEPT